MSGSCAKIVSLLRAPLASLVANHRLLRRTTLIEVRALFAGSLLGSVWVVLGPVLLLALYTLVYTVIFRVRPVSMTVADYVLYVFSGLVPFLTFSAAIPAGASSLASNRQLLLNTVFPSELIPVRSVLVASASFPAGLAILFVSDLGLSHVAWTWLLVPVVAILQVLFVIGVSWVISLAVLLIRDIQQLISYVMMLLLVITPIAYTPDMIPGHLKWLMLGNPLAYFVTSYQSLIVLDSLPPVRVCVVTVLMTVIAMTLGHAAAHQAKKTFYDLV